MPQEKSMTDRFREPDLDPDWGADSMTEVLPLEPNVTVELYARVGYTYSKSGGWGHKDATVSAKISGVPTEDSDWQAARIGEHLENLSVMAEQRASAEIARRNLLGADGPTSEIVTGDDQGFSGG
jgi:hypothetical protein